jgi:hypothetical protein
LAFPPFFRVGIASLAVLALQRRTKPMPNYFYSENGQKYGPLTEQRLQVLVNRGTIKRSTPLESDTGQKGLAGQIPGLVFPELDDEMEETYSHSQSGESQGTAIISWLFDFAFRDTRLPVVNLWVCRIAYIFVWIMAVLTVFSEFTMMWASSQGGNAEILIQNKYFLMSGFEGFVLLLIELSKCCLSIVVVRLVCEWQIILLDWITETKKAARLYIENSKRDREK